MVQYEYDKQRPRKTYIIGHVSNKQLIWSLAGEQLDLKIQRIIFMHEQCHIK